MGLSITDGSELKAELHRELKKQREMPIQIALDHPRHNWNFTKNIR